MGTTKKSYLENQLYKFARINKIRREYKNHYFFKGVGVHIQFMNDGYIHINSLPFCLLGHSVSITVSSIPELIYKLVKHRFLPVSLSDLKYKPFNYTQTQLNLFTEYEQKLIELRKENLIQLMSNDVNHYIQMANVNLKIKQFVNP